MVLVKIFMVGIAFIALMGVAREQNWPQRAGVTGSCIRTQPPSTSPGGTWFACKQGILTGYPPLEADSCKSAGIVEHREIWKCDGPLTSLPGY